MSDVGGTERPHARVVAPSIKCQSPEDLLGTNGTWVESIKGAPQELIKELAVAFSPLLGVQVLDSVPPHPLIPRGTRDRRKDSGGRVRHMVQTQGSEPVVYY